MALPRVPIDRANATAFVSRPTIAKQEIPIASAEDLITMKVLAGRPKDLEDVNGIVRANPTLDIGVVRETLRLLEQALDQNDLLPVFERLWTNRSP